MRCTFTIRRPVGGPGRVGELRRSPRAGCDGDTSPGLPLTGGGARVQWNGAGMMLTACGPVKDGEHLPRMDGKGEGSRPCRQRKVTVWAFGIRPKDGSATTPSKVKPHSAPDATIPTMESGVNAGGSSWWRMRRVLPCWRVHHRHRFQLVARQMDGTGEGPHDPRHPDL